MDKLKFAVIGLGWFGEKHCEALSGIPSVATTGCCSPRIMPLPIRSAASGVTASPTTSETRASASAILLRSG